VSVIAASVWAITSPALSVAVDPAQAEGRIGDPARGALVFAAGDCASCHASPGQSDRLRLGGGMALASPYGIFRVPNISSDRVDGIGAWQMKDLANALLNGVSPNGSHYYPVFPYSSFTHMQPGYVADLMAYLRTLPAVSGRPPRRTISPHPSKFDALSAFGSCSISNAAPPVRIRRARTKWNRGRYLAEAVAHCAECHSSRDIFGGIKTNTRYAGGQDPEGTGFYPNITPARIGDWSERDIVEMLKSGNTPNHGRVGSSMTDVVTNTAMLPEADREAIASYIKSLPPRSTPKP